MAPCRSSKSYLVFFLNKEHEEDKVIEEEEEKAKRKIRTKKKYKMGDGQMDRGLNCGGSVDDEATFIILWNDCELVVPYPCPWWDWHSCFP